MLLPAQHRTAEDDAVLFGGRFQRLKLASGTKIGQCGAIALGGIAGGIECKMQNSLGRFDRRKRAGMHLTENRRAQGMRREFAAIFDRNIHDHAPRSHARDPFAR